jgi:D-beta-D-heptose 7-phosphate kinase/D-beta-D-heptose 1-phosphate adenosyltransferase
MGTGKETTDAVAPARVLVLGDIMLDQYTWGRAERVSPEAPVLVVQADTCEVRLGGAGAVAGLLRGLDAEVLLAGIVGDDPEGRIVRQLLDETGIDGRLALTDVDRPTTHKQRFLATVEQRQPHQILRVDHERTHPLARELAESLAGATEKELPNVDALLISDYAKGVCTPELLARVIGAAREQGLPVLVDPARIGDYERYRGATLVKPNRREAELVTGWAIHSPADALEAGRELVRYDLQAVVVTLDGDGMVLVTAEGTAEHVPTWERQVADITGAGDMVLAVLGLYEAEKSKSDKGEKCENDRVDKSNSRKVEESGRRGDSEVGRGAGLFEGGQIGLRGAVELANVAAGLEVERVGVAPVTRREIAEAVQKKKGTGPICRNGPKGASHKLDLSPFSSRGSTKVITLDEMVALAAAYRHQGKTVVFTNGCFDLLHVGHVTYLEQAATLGDVLVVAVNSDASVRRLEKGPDRPIVPEADRAAMLAALACVDHVLIFEEATPHRLLEAIRPDVLVKGGTYTVDQVVGHEIVERYGGRVCVTGMQPGVSTTQLVGRIRKRRAAGRVDGRELGVEG